MEAGNTAKGISVYEPEIEEISGRVLAKLQWYGIASLGFKHDEVEKRFIFMEVNPRFGGSLYLHVAAGVDFPYLFYQMFVFKREMTDGQYRVGVRYHSVFEENLQRALLSPCYLPGYLWDCLDPRVKSEIDFSDPGPLPHQLQLVVWRIQNRKKVNLQ